MAITASRYNQTEKLFANGEVSLAYLKFMLLDDSASFDATHTTIDAVAGALSGSPSARAHEVYGNGWSQGGEDLADAAITVVNTNEAKLTADAITVEATGGAIGPASYGVIYDASSGKPLIWIDFDGDETAGEGTDFKYTPSTDGIIHWLTPS